MYESPVILLQLGGLSITAYGCVMALAALLGVACTVLMNRKRLGTDTSLSVALWATVGAVLGGHIVYCIANYGNLMADYEGGMLLLLTPHMGGYALYGALLGGLAALALYARVTHKPCLPLLDAAVPGSLLALCVGRLAEAFSTNGLGDMIEDEAMMFFPMGVPIQFEDVADYMEWHVPVFFYEAVAALVILAAVLVMLRKDMKPGMITMKALTLVGAVQIFMEQIRVDNFIEYGFIRFTQMAAIITIAAIFAIRLIAAVKKQGFTRAMAVRIALFAACILIVIFVEFALEKPKFRLILQLCLLAAVAIYDYLAFFAEKRGKAAALAATVIGVVCIVLLFLGLSWENTVLMAVMALALAGITAAVEI